MTLAEKVRAIRSEKSLTQKELAGRAGMDQRAISRIEQGHVSPFDRTVHRLAKALDVPAAWLRNETLGMADLQRMQREADSEAERLQGLSLVPVFELDPSNRTQWFDEHPVGFAGEYMPALTTDRRASEGYYCRIHGDTMEPDFSDGCLVFLMPDQETREGDPCLVRTSDGYGTFKRVFGVGKNRVRLQPSNPRYALTVVEWRDVERIHRVVFITHEYAPAVVDGALPAPIGRPRRGSRKG